MLEYYEVGQKLAQKDVVSDYYIPVKWEYAEIVSIEDDLVELKFVDLNNEIEETQYFTKQEMSEALGWE